jgi:phosphoribosylanthranilate isomerase
VEKIRIKICGMREPANIRSVAALHPDYLGFIEYKPSPRFVGNGFRVPLMSANIARVGVFVDETFERILVRVAESGYDAIQLHGHESPDFAARLRDKGLQVIKVFRIDEAFDFGETNAFVHSADYFLFDARGKHPGGNGIQFDAQILKRYDQRVPFFLSGGLRPETLEDDLAGLKNMNLYGVDLNSGVEQAPGLKDPERVKASIDYARRA